MRRWSKMGKSNTELYKIASSYLGDGGSRFRSYCGLPSGAAWCCAFVTYIFHKGADDALFYGGKKVVYVPTAEKWCSAHLAQIPIYLAMPMDIITFDWNNNGVPDHIGFVRERKSDTEVYTIEGNTSGGIVAKKTRPLKYISGVFRPEFKGKFDTSKALTIDGQCGYHTIASLQKALGIKVDGILGKQTVKSIQKLCGAAQDGSWGKKTSKKLQSYLGVKADGYWGIESTKALQKWCNKKNGFTTSTPSVEAKAPKVTTLVDREMDACKEQATWMKNYVYKWQNNPTVEKSKKYGTCVTYVACVLQRIGVLKSGEAIWHNHGKVDGANKKMSVAYPSGTIRSNKSKLKKGDIIIAGDKSSMEAGGNSHICVLTGKWDENDNPYVYDNNSATRVKKGKKPKHTLSGSMKMIARIRLKG